MEYVGRIAFHTLLFWICLSFVSCEENSEQHENVPDLNGKICPSADINFMQTVASTIECAFMCKKDATCKSVVYSSADRTCSGCALSLYEPSSLGERPGAVFYKPSIVVCGPLSFDDSHVLLGPHDGDNSGGASIMYSCQPCTYFPSSTPAEVTCLETGVWSSPSCVFGSDVGYTKNGVSVPDGAKGCMSEMGTKCSPTGKIIGGFTMQGTTADCLCDDVCCGYGDCCFDADCFIP